MISRSMGPRTKNCVDPTLRRSEEGWFLHCYDEMLLLSGWVSVNLHCFSLSSDILWICKIAYYWFITFLYLNGPGGKVRMRCIQLYGKLHKQKHAQRVQNKIALRKMAINKNKRKSVHRTQVSISQKKKRKYNTTNRYCYSWRISWAIKNTNNDTAIQTNTNWWYCAKTMRSTYYIAVVLECVCVCVIHLKSNCVRLEERALHPCSMPVEYG